MKSVEHFSGGIQGVAMYVLKDVQSILGTPYQEAERDRARLHSLIEHRGVGYLTLDLPAMGKVFDRALADRALPEKLSCPGFGPKLKGSTLPRFLGSMWEAVFDLDDGRLRDEPCIATIACFRQIFFCLKKARLACDPERITETFADFRFVDEGLRDACLDWHDPLEPNNAMFNNYLNDGCSEQPGNPEIVDGGNAIRDHGFWELLNVVQQCYDLVASNLGTFYPEHWSPKHGAGAVADARLGREYKYSFPNWSSRLESVFPQADFGYANVGLWADAVKDDQTRFDDREVPSRLITVPKDMKAPRLIAAEPIANQFCQQSILGFLVDRVHNGYLKGQINFWDQELSRDMALSASTTQSHATIDLKHASDSVSCWLVERFFNRNRSVLNALMATRTSQCRFPDGELMNLKKFTTMGAATTFPVQSIIFATTCVAVEAFLASQYSYEQCKAFLKKGKSRSRVFGDDLIVPTDSAELVIRVLNYLGFEVNTDKSFLTGKFREACGMAAYDGVEVTQTYVYEVYDKSRPSTLASVRECSNNLHLAGYWQTAAYLASTIPQDIRENIPVVQADSGRPGWVSFVGANVSLLKKRWNKTLQRKEVRVLDVIPRTSRISPGGNGALLQYFLEAPNPDSMVTWSHGYEQRPGLVVKTRWEDLALLDSSQVE